MSAYIALDDGRSWWAANWAYDAVIEGIASELDRNEPERKLADWVRHQTCRNCGPGLGSIDVRELSPASRSAFRGAAQRAFRSAIFEGPAGWNDPSFYPGWLSRFRRLLRMWKAIDRGESPDQLSDSLECMEPTGRKLGPGWDAEETSAR